MDNMKRLYTVCFAIGAFLMPSCSDMEELRSDVDDLKSRVQALETQLAAFNSNVEALQELASSTTINTVTETAGGYELLMSNGKTIVLDNGRDGDGITPDISIDSDGYWIVDYKDGNGYVYILCSGEKVKAVGLDGIVPVFGVDADGYWTVDTGSGPVNVLDSDGNKVKVTASQSTGNPFFSSATYDAAQEKFVIELKDESKSVLELHVVENFLFSITGADEGQVFKAGETKRYPVARKGVGTATVSRPAGWTVSLTEEELTVTAPQSSAVASKAVIADTRTDVAVMAYCSFDGYATIARLRVSLEGETGRHEPKASVYLAEEPGLNTLRLTVTLSDATGYRYIFGKVSDGLPALEDVAENGTESTGTLLEFTGLDDKTEYALSVLPYHEDTAAEELTVFRASTAKPVYSSHYEAYLDDEVLTVGGVDISKATFPDAVLLGAEDNVIRADGVYFVPDGVTAQITSDTGTRGTLIVIGDNPSSHGKIEFSGTVTRLGLDPARGGSLILFNLDFDVATDNGQGQILFYPANESGGTLETVAFEDCGLDLGGLQGMSFTTDTRSESTKIRIERLVIEGCDINVGEGTRFGYFFQYRKHNEIGDFIFRDNVVWSPDAGNNARLLNGAQSASAGDFAIATPVERFEMEHNTWVNCKGSPMNYVRSVGRYVLRNNLFYGSITSYTPVIRYSETAELDGSPESGSVRDNICYVVGGASVIWKAANPNEIAGIEEYEQIRKVSEDPFVEFDTSAGVFVTSEAYSAYGARR